MYGAIRNVSGGGNIRLTVGTLSWRFTLPGGQSTFTVTASLTNIHDQFSYILLVPCETEILGVASSPNVLRLASYSLTYNRSSVTVQVGDESAPLVLAQPEQADLIVTSLDRGRIERVDLLVNLALIDSNGNGLPDFWEDQYFGGLGVDPSRDTDGDGLPNLDEYKAGTNPTDPSSRFAFIDVAPHPDGGTAVQWSSVEGTRYIIERSLHVLNGYAPIMSGIVATPPVNTYQDSTAGPIHFYRLRLEE